ncbi:MULTISPECIES: SIR2 family protein [Arcobacteraceae]|uniref:SIR2 family protein n=1 Tax=Aliarcobacter skirrowii TaxID=28200 RepID=A0AAW9DCK0_9BACT|nr:MULTISPECIES: SIR2 family protein [Arcobacteraceae]MDX4069842.1 SIR2 family protein [Aliarcobacter skirrowii]RXK03293.1 SIR2 family protein [Halarcobacter bivalviorum]RYA23696.1 SIR2 family protein [Malaciobacter halophilus]
MRKYILISNELSLEIDDDNLYINGEIYKTKDDEDFREIAINKKREYYKKKLEKLLLSDNLLLLTGAGTSIGFGGKIMSELWDEAEKLTLGEGTFVLFCQSISYDTEIKDLEALLSEAEINLKSSKELPSWFKDFKLEIEKMIKRECSFNLTDTDFETHLTLLQKLTQRKVSKSRLKIYNLNYDLSFEQAAQKGGFTIIDGFSFTQPRVFNGRYYDYDIVRRENSRLSAEENYVDKVFHLYKPHGSVNWAKKDTDIIQRDKEEDFHAVMIYPNATKFEHSYEQPFFEVMSRFQIELRKTSSSTLIISGFSLADKHIMTMVKEAIRQNSSLNVIIVNRSIQYKSGSTKDKEWSFYRELSKISPHVILVEEGFKDFVKNIPYDLSKKPEESFLEKLEELIGKQNG